MNSMIEINGRKIGNEFPPYIIAEMSANHNGDINNAYKIIDKVKLSGADAVKLQTYHPDIITMDMSTPEFMINGGLWGGQSLHSLYKSAFMPWEWHKPLFEYAKKNDITIFSSPFDNTAVDLLEDLDTPAYKIASFEVIDVPLIKYVAQTKKPMIISTGMADHDEIYEAVEAARESGCKELALLHCVSSYPAPSSDYNLRTLPDIQQKFQTVIGLSDHTINNITALSSIALGASIIEKHVTLDRTNGGPDDSFSLEPEELNSLCIEAKIAWESLGKINYETKLSEKENLKFRKSLYVVKDLEAGEKLSINNIRAIRPGYGLHPRYYDQLIGSKVVKKVSKGTPISWELVKK
jgi:pseudaminic acid synthase